MAQISPAVSLWKYSFIVYDYCILLGGLDIIDIEDKSNRYYFSDIQAQRLTHIFLVEDVIINDRLEAGVRPGVSVAGVGEGGESIT